MTKHIYFSYKYVNYIKYSFFIFYIIAMLHLVFQLPIAQASEISGYDQDALQNAFGTNSGASTVAGDVTFGPGGYIIFGHSYNSEPAVVIYSSDKKLIGSSTDNFTSSIINLVYNLFDQISNSDNTNQYSNILSSTISPVLISFEYKSLPFIHGDGFARTVTGSLNTVESTKLIRLDLNSNANNFSMLNVRIGNFNLVYNHSGMSTETYQDQGVVNGLIGNNRSVKVYNSFGSFTGNDFHDINITINTTTKNVNAFLAGGGIIGLRSTLNSTYIENISGNLFRSINITTADPSGNYEGPFIQGGGIIGLDAVFKPIDTPGYAQLDFLENNIFTDIEVNSVNGLMGGGIIGLNNNSTLYDPIQPKAYIYLYQVSNNIFGIGSQDDIKISTIYALGGGGIIGLNATANARLYIQTISSNIFAGNTLNIGTYLGGGGIIGFQNNDESAKYANPDPCVPDGSAESCVPDPSVPLQAERVAGYIAVVESNLFTDIKVTTGLLKDHAAFSGDYRGGGLEGGGIIGGRSESGFAVIGAITGNLFSTIEIETNSGTSVGLFEEGDLRGGGIIGLSSGTTATISNVSLNSFLSNTITVANQLDGGGIIGVYSGNNDPAANLNPQSSIETVGSNIFDNNTVSVASDIYGGGIIGGRIFDGQSTLFNTTITGAGQISNNFFQFSDVTANSIHGGGIIGFYADDGNNVIITEISNNHFIKNSIKAIKNQIEGGGLIGVYNESYNLISYIGYINNNIIEENTVESELYIDGGGIIGVDADNFGASYTGIYHIESNTMTKNIVTANNGQIMGGLIYTYGLTEDLTIRNNNFQDNTFISVKVLTSLFNPDLSIAAYFVPKVYGTITIDTGLKRTDYKPNTVIVEATSNKQTIFRNNKIQEDQEVRTNSFYFGTVLAMDPSAIPINVVNDPPKSDAYLKIVARSDGKVYLYDPIVVNQVNMDSTDTSNPDRTFKMDVTGPGEFYWGGANVFEVAAAYDPAIHDVENVVELLSASRTMLLPGMSLEAENHVFDLKQGAYLEPQGFDSNGKNNKLIVSKATFSGQMHFPIVGSYLNDHNRALLSVSSLNQVDVSNATVSLGGFSYSGTLNGGDMFYLMETDVYEGITGTPSNQTATAMQNLSLMHTFTIDNQAGDDSGGQTNKKMVARLAKTELAPETKALAEGHAAGLVFLSHIGSWLPDYSYYTAELAIRRLDAWQAFSGFDASSFRAQTGSHVNVKGVTFLVGVAKKTQNSLGSFLFGGFLEGGVSDYEVVTDVVADNMREVGGNGTLRSFGVGIMASQKFDNGFRVESSFRYGSLENDFVAENYVSASGTVASFRMTAPYLGAHLGLGYSHDVAGVGNFDYSVKYYYSRLAGKTVHIGEGDEVTYAPTNSHRVRAGLRFTKPFSDRVSFYVGGHFDHEFDNRSKAKVYNMDVKTAGIQGSTGIFELGGTIKSRSNEHLSIEFGLQGYVGTFRGISGGVRLGYEF